MTNPAQALLDFNPRHTFLVGIDSDGCAFDTMEIKHKECFIPNIIQYWDLQPVSKYARQAAEFVNSTDLARHEPVACAGDGFDRCASATRSSGVA